jgi:hypothetical protein
MNSLLNMVGQTSFASHAASSTDTNVDVLSYDAIAPVAIDEAFAERYRY